MANEQEVLEALKQVEDPDLHRDIVALGFVQDLKVDNSSVSLRIVLTTPACPVKAELKAQAEEIILGLPGVTDVEVNMDAEVRSNQPGGGSARPVEGVRNIIAIASNKGGVGKTTVSVNLAVALAKQGARVGLLDADVTGPTAPSMLGVESGCLAEGECGLPAWGRWQCARRRAQTPGWVASGRNGSAAARPRRSSPGASFGTRKAPEWWICVARFAPIAAPMRP